MPRRPPSRPVAVLLHEICHALRRAEAPPLLVSMDATDRDDVAAIPGLGLLLAEAGRAGVRRIAADGAIAVAALADGDLRAIRASPAPSTLAISSWGPHLPLMTAIARIDPEDGFVVAPGPLEAPSAHARAAQAALAASLPPTARERLRDLLASRPAAPRNGSARLIWRRIGPFRILLEDGLRLPVALVETRP